MADCALKLEAEVEGLTPGDTRYFRVKALDREGLESLWSEVASGSSKPLPDAPAGLAVASEGQAFRISWTAPAQEDVTEYKVWVKRLLSWELLGATEQTSFEIPHGDITKPVQCTVTAVDRDGLESVRSESVRVEPNAQ